MRKSSIFVALSILILTIIWIGSGQLNQKQEKDNSKEISEISKTQKNEINVRIKNSTGQEIYKIISIQGQTTANKVINIKSETSGKIKKINKSVGSKINKNELIFKISEEDLIINLDEKKSKFQEMQIEYDAVKSLYESGLSSDSKLAKAKSNLETAKSNYISVKNEIEKTNIYSPFDGILTSNHLEVGEFVQPGTTLGVFIELNPILIIGYVSEKELKNLEINSKALVTTSLEKDVEGLISYISPIAEKDTRTFRIEIKVSNDNLEIKDGLTASIVIQGEKVEAHKISPSILSLKDDGNVGIKIVNNKNIVEFFPIEVVSDTNEGMWISGIPKKSNIIIVGQEYAPVGEEVNFEK